MHAVPSLRARRLSVLALLEEKALVGQLGQRVGERVLAKLAVQSLAHHDHEADVEADEADRVGERHEGAHRVVERLGWPDPADEVHMTATRASIPDGHRAQDKRHGQAAQQHFLLDAPHDFPGREAARVAIASENRLRRSRSLASE